MIWHPSHWRTCAHGNRSLKKTLCKVFFPPFATSNLSPTALGYSELKPLSWQVFSSVRRKPGARSAERLPVPNRFDSVWLDSCYVSHKSGAKSESTLSLKENCVECCVQEEIISSITLTPLLTRWGRPAFSSLLSYCVIQVQQETGCKMRLTTGEIFKKSHKKLYMVKRNYLNSIFRPNKCKI